MLAVGACPGIRDAERIALVEWARRHELILDHRFVEQFRHVSSGAEHAVFHDPSNGLAVKTTHANQFGHSARDEGTRATPLEYLQRLAWHNFFFGDDLRLLGVTLDEGNLEVVTSQPWIVANPARVVLPGEIDEYFGRMGFNHIEITPDVPLFYNPPLNVLIADAHAQNVLVDEEGRLIPIDVVIGRPGEKLRERLRETMIADRRGRAGA